MSNKKLVLLLNTNKEYIRHIEESEVAQFAPELSELFYSITNTYIPLLSMFENLERDGVPFKLQMVMTPILCTLLEDPVVQAQYVDYLDKLISFGEKEKKRLSKEPALLEIAVKTLEKNKKTKSDFKEKYAMRLVPQFAEYQRKGHLELMATTGSSAFLPFYTDIPEIINAQVEAGLLAHKNFFGEIPDGFWLPGLGYAEGVEKAVRSYGFNYTVLDSRSTLFSKNIPENGIFYPCRFYNSLVAFTAQKNIDSILYGEEGFAQNPVYRNERRDISFELPSKQISSFIAEGVSRYPSGYKYFNKSSSQDDVYKMDEASSQAKEDAISFIRMKNEELEKASSLAKNADFVSEVCVIDVENMRRTWHEGLEWIEELFRNASVAEFDFDSCGSLIKNQYNLQKITAYYASSLGDGYGENLLSSKNSWMMRYIRKASERMVDLADRFPTDTGLKARLLDLAAKELMIAQDLGWVKMLDEDIFPDYVKKVFTECIQAFTTVFDSLGSNTVSTEWLTNLEANHPLFPWMNYRIFSTKQ